MKWIEPIFRFILPGFLTVVAISCTVDTKNDGQGIFEKHDTILPPQIIKAGEAIVNNLDDMDAPQTVQLSQRSAPIKTAAGFYVDMQNFNTQQGLALSSILCGYKDRAGTLWFGTSGNGVSRYDGKSFTNYTSAHGLIHNLINCITEDSKGNIWFGTYGGVSKYDGKIFENFTVDQGLPDNDVLKITEDRHGVLWVGTEKGLCSFDPKKSGGKKPFVGSDKNGGPWNSPVYDIIEDRQGQLWLAGYEGVWRSTNQSESAGKKEFMDLSDKFGLKDRSASSLAEDRNGTLWVGTNSSAFRYTPPSQGRPEKMFDPIQLANGAAEETVTCITVDARGSVWLGTYGGVSKYDQKTGALIRFTKAQGLSFDRVNSITEDDAGSLWFGTYGGGLDRYDGEGVMQYTTAQGLPGNAIYATVRDEDGNIWLAPSNAGIVKYAHGKNDPYGGTFTTYTMAQGLLQDTHYAAAKDKEGNLYFGGYDGLSKFTGKKIINYIERNGLPDHYITALYTDKAGKLWIGTFNGGVSVFDGKSFRNISTPQGLVHKTVWCFWEDQKGIIWIATRGGLSRYDGKSFMNFTKDQGLPDNKLSSVMQDKNGNIIIGSWGGGISVIKKERAEELMLPEVGKGEPIFENFSTSQGLANNVVYQIVEDKNGNIVIGTNVGFTVLKGGVTAENGKIAKNNAENFNENTGYAIKDISNNGSMQEGRPSVIWAGTGDKLVRFDYGSIRKSTRPPEVFIQNIKIDNEAISWRSLEWARKKGIPSSTENSGTPAYVTDALLTFEKKPTDATLDTMVQNYRNLRFDSVRPFYAIPVDLLLPYSKNNINFDFVGVETTRPAQVRYQYMLEGYDKHWSPITAASTATFGNIHEGNYAFLVKAKGPGGVWSEPVKYNFKIMPPWYRAWYAYLLYFLLFFVMLFYVDRHQRKRVLRLERQKP
jgi:ligand-binding sensor domain-containing protein